MHEWTKTLDFGIIESNKIFVYSFHILYVCYRADLDPNVDSNIIYTNSIDCIFGQQLESV